MQNKLNLRLFALTNVFAGVQLLIAKFIWIASVPAIGVACVWAGVFLFISLAATSGGRSK